MRGNNTKKRFAAMPAGSRYLKGGRMLTNRFTAASQLHSCSQYGTHVGKVTYWESFLNFGIQIFDRCSRRTSVVEASCVCPVDSDKFLQLGKQGLYQIVETTGLIERVIGGDAPFPS